jgi:16S rRNA processing protein RimM
MDDGDRLVPIGRVGRPHGLDGSFVVEQASDDPRRWEPGAPVLVDGVRHEVVSSRRVGRGHVAVRLDGAAPRGAQLAVREADLPPPDPDSWYAFQLVGLRVEEEGGRALGRVAAVVPGVANDNLELEDGTLLPLVDAAVRAVDVDAGVVQVTAGFLG